MELLPSLHNMLTDLQGNPRLKYSTNPSAYLSRQWCQFYGRWKRDTGNELIPDVNLRVRDVMVAILKKKKHVDRLGTERDVSWLYHGTTLRNTTRTALFHFFLITFSVKIGKCSPGSAPEAATVYKIFLSPSIGAVSRNFETNMYVLLRTHVYSRICKHL